jgi:hypothetical protein
MILATIIASIALLFFAYAESCALATRRLSLYEFWANEFFSNIKPLIEDVETPTAVLKMLSFLNRRLDDSGVAHMAVLALHFSTSERRERLPADNKVGDQLLEFFRRRPELGKAFFRAATAGFLALSYSASPLTGWLIRKNLIRIGENPSKEESRFFVAKFERCAHEELVNQGNGHTACR